MSISIGAGRGEWELVLTDFLNERVEFFFGAQRDDENFCGCYDWGER
jgi:hypothetical protein